MVARTGTLSTAPDLSAASVCAGNSVKSAPAAGGGGGGAAGGDQKHRPHQACRTGGAGGTDIVAPPDTVIVAPAGTAIVGSSGLRPLSGSRAFRLRKVRDVPSG